MSDFQGENKALMHYPFGMLMPGRNFGSETYRFGFQNQEKDDEIKGDGNSVNYTFRVHDPRLGRFFSVDPLFKEYPYYSSYQFSGNRLIDAIEREGLEHVDYRRRDVDGVTVQIDSRKHNDPNGNLTENTTVRNDNTNATGNAVNSTDIITVPGRGIKTNSILNSATQGGPQFRNDAPQSVPSATQGNPQTGNEVYLQLPVNNQFNQGVLIRNVNAVTGQPVNTPPIFSNGVVNEIQNPTNTQLVPNNTSRVLVITNGSAVSVANAQQQIGILQGQYPRIQFALASSPNPTGIPLQNNQVISVYNPTQNVANQLIGGGNFVIPFNTPMIPTAPNLPFNQSWP